MKFTAAFAATAAAFLGLAHAAPVAVSAANITETLIPAEAVVGGLEIPSDVYPVFTSENNTSRIVFLNATVLSLLVDDEEPAKRGLAADEHLLKREAKADAWSWIALRLGQPSFKRDAIAEADAWSWIALRLGQPSFKRDAIAEAGTLDWESLKEDAELENGLGKRSADAWSWIALRLGQPSFKRDAIAEASADAWSWIALRLGQPSF